MGKRSFGPVARELRSQKIYEDCLTRPEVLYLENKLSTWHIRKDDLSKSLLGKIKARGKVLRVHADE